MLSKESLVTHHTRYINYFTILPNIKKLIVRYGDETYVFPYRIRNLYGLKVCESLGRNTDGGLIPLKNFDNIHDAFKILLSYLKNKCHLATMTLRLWLSPYRELFDFLSRTYSYSYLYPRLLYLKDFDTLWKSISKKARNRYRYFVRHGGDVITADPLNYVKDILRINYSNPYRQGRLLPMAYLEPREVYRSARTWSKYIQKGYASFYLALIDNSSVGYAYIPHYGGHAYTVRFMPDSNYLKYGVGNGLLLSIIKDLIENEKAYVFQYGYWRNVNPGVNHFLEQHNFKTYPEAFFIIPLHSSLSTIRRIYNLYVKLTNISRVRIDIRREH